jgi:hypothetical protein
VAGSKPTGNFKARAHATVEPFKFRRADRIGAADAATDDYLSSCFVDTGAVEVLKELGQPHRLVVGRTGSGKTALLAHLERDVGEHAITIRAENLALTHISNSTILRFLRDLGVKLDLFFRLLWRHVFAVEILKKRFRIFDETQKRSFFDRVADYFKSREHRQAVEYLKKWGGDRFWEKTDIRIKELTATFETEVTKSLGGELTAKLGGLKAGYARTDKLTAEERAEVVERAQRVVNEVQMRELSNLIDLIGHVLEDSGDYYYILLDRLDENWVEEYVRYLLIRALLETVKDFLRVKRCKIVVALRFDLMRRVFDRTRDAGFQEEKYLSSVLRLEWTDAELAQILDRRVAELIRRRYTQDGATHTDVMPVRVEGKAPIDYLLERTLRRPRDVIHFFNLCLQEADGQAKVTVSAIRRAEAIYSADRLRFLRDEWYADFPDLLQWIDLLRANRSCLTVADLDLNKCADTALRIVADRGVAGLCEAARLYYEQSLPEGVFIRKLVEVFYRVGIVGLKLAPAEPTQWMFRSGRDVSAEEIGHETSIQIHKLAWRTLGIAA